MSEAIWLPSGGFWIPGACLAGLVLLGLLLQKKPAAAILTGMFNAVCGYFLLCLGAGLILGVTRPVSQMIADATGVHIVFGSNEAAVALFFSRYVLLSLGILMAMCALNIALARYTKYKVVFFTGHVLVFTATMLAVLLRTLTDWPAWIIVPVGGTIGLGINLLSMAMCQKYIDLLPNGRCVALAHTGNVSVLLTGVLASKLGKKEDSAERCRVSSKWSFFRDASVASAATMTVLFFALRLIAGGWASAADAVGFALKNGVLFGISISIILLGIRFTTGDLVSTMKFFVDKLAPGAKLGVDAPMFFSCAQKSWLLAFLIAYPLSLLFSWILAGVVGLPCVAMVCSVPCFFDAGIAGVVGNAVGGRRGVFLGGVIHALVMAVGLSLLGALVPLAQETGVIWGGPDAAAFGTILGFIFKAVG